MENQLSVCHRARVFVPETDEGTKYYVCSQCNKACDVEQMTMSVIDSACKVVENQLEPNQHLSRRYIARILQK